MFRLVQIATMATGRIGVLDSFDSNVESWECYYERFEQYAKVNKLEEEDVVPCLLSLMGPKTYGLLRTLVAPEKPKDKTADQIYETLQTHLSPTPLTIAERFRFYKRDQKAGESIADYLEVIKRLAETCDFGDFLAIALRDKFVCGLNNEQIQKRLLTESKLTFQKAQSVAFSMETAARDAHELSQAKHTTSGVHKMSSKGEKGKRKYMDKSKNKPQKNACYRCGRSNHTPDECYFKDRECYKCKQKGHHKDQCKAKMHKVVDITQDNSDSDVDVPLYKIDDNSSDAMFVTLDVEGRTLRMELDTGASVSVIGVKQYKEHFSHLPLKDTKLRLEMYNKTVSHPEGVIEVVVKNKDQTHKLPLYVIKQGDLPLLGRNWLKVVQLDWPQIKALKQSEDKEDKAIKNLQKEYEDVFSSGCGKMEGIKATLKLKEGATPKFVKARHVPLAKKDKINAKLDQLEKENIVKKVSHSDWAAPIVTPLKKDGSVRVCGDFKVTINPQLEVEQYPLPRIDEIFANLAGGQQFSLLDLRQAYLQMEVEEESQPYLTINTHRGLYRYCRMVYGVASAPALWQRAMDQVLQGLPMVQCYLDDIIITGKDFHDHLENLSKVFERLKQYGLKVNLAKCVFFKKQVSYLGHKIDADGLHKTDDKIKAIIEAPEPKNVGQLRSFLGLVQYYHKFLPNLANVLHPLHQLLQTKCKWNWSQRHATSFKQVKEAVASETVLAHFDPNLPVHLACDASPYGVGAVLSHITEDGNDRPIAFASRSLSPAEKNYAQMEREALAIVFGVKKFNQYLEGRKFTLVTDNEPLLAIFHPRKGIPSTAAARLVRWAVTLSGYQYDIKYRNTKYHGNVDALSRLPLQCQPQDSATTFRLNILDTLPVTCAELRDATRKDRVLVRVLESTRVGWNDPVEDPKLKAYSKRRKEFGLYDGCIMWGERIVVPEKLQKRILEDLHEGHLGIVKMKGLARSYVWWPGIDMDIEQMAKSCGGCQEVQRAPALAPQHPWEFPSRPWKRIHIDFCGPFQDRMYLVVVDAHSKWPEVIPMKTTTTEQTIDALRTIFARWGLPEQLVSDNGPQFTSDQFEVFMRENNVKHLRGAPYHPATNGQAERFVQTFKRSMKAEKKNVNLYQRLARFLMAYRNAPHAITGEPPAVLMMGRKLRSRLDMCRPDLKRKMEDQVKAPAKELREFKEDETVMVRNYMAGPKWIPGTIVRKSGRMSYDVSVGTKVWKRHTDQITETGVELDIEKQPQMIPPVPVNVFPSVVPPMSLPRADEPEVNERVPVPDETVQTPQETPPSESASNRRYPVRERVAPKRLIEE